jgi:O-antigen/teichoic acid export membrane protein
VLVLLLMFGSGVVLARALPPADFGLFAIALFVIVLAGMLTELGLQPALIQRAGALGEHELRTALAIQQAAVTAVVALLWLGAGGLPLVYPKTSPALTWLVRLMSVELYLASWRDMSETLLERALRYERLAPIDVVGSVVYATVAVGMALRGGGVWSFACAFLASSVLRTILLYRAAPWPLRPAFDRHAARRLLRVGAPVQIGRIVNQAQYWVTPTLVAGMIGPEAVGLLQWAAGNGRKPLEFLESVVRVSLPHFSILQDDAREVERLLSRYVLVFALVCGLWFAVLGVAAHDLVALVYTARWEPAVPALVLFAGVGLLVSLRVIVGTALVGLGRVVFAARVSAIGALVTIVASVGLVVAVGGVGVPLGQLVGASVTLPWLTAGLGRGAIVRVLAPALAVLVPIGAAVGVGLVVHGTALAPPLRGFVTATTMTLAYGAVAWWAAPPWLRTVAWQEIPLRATSDRA